MKTTCGIFALALLVPCLGLPQQPAKPPAPRPVVKDAPFQAYWLSSVAQGESKDYPRLLITHGPIENLAGHKTWSKILFDSMAFSFRTYRRDSFWDEPFQLVDQMGEVDASAHTAIIDGTACEYESCPLSDVLRLLDNPEGGRPIHRRTAPLAGAEQTAKAFRLLLESHLNIAVP